MKLLIGYLKLVFKTGQLKFKTVSTLNQLQVEFFILIGWIFNNFRINHPGLKIQIGLGLENNGVSLLSAWHWRLWLTVKQLVKN